MRISRGGKAAIAVVASAGIVSTPLYWLLGSPDAGQMVAASVQGATGIVALVWTVLASPGAAQPEPEDIAVATGAARATGGGTASTGIRRPGGAGRGSARAEHTGRAVSDGTGSHASTGVDSS